MVQTMSKTEELAQGDYGTPEARRRAFWVVEQPDPEQRASRRIRVEQSQPDWLLRRGHIQQVHADAFSIWSSDGYNSGLLPACIGGYQQSVRGGTSELSDIRLAAQARRANAIKFVVKLRTDAALFLDAVILDGKAAGRWWMEHIGGNPSEAIDVLCKLGNGLARHYGIAK